MDCSRWLMEGIGSGLPDYDWELICDRWLLANWYVGVRCNMEFLVFFCYVLVRVNLVDVVIVRSSPGRRASLVATTMEVNAFMDRAVSMFIHLFDVDDDKGARQGARLSRQFYGGTVMHGHHHHHHTLICRQRATGDSTSPI